MIADNQLIIVDLLNKNSYYTTAELAQKVGISQRKVKENLRKLKEMGLLNRIGTAKVRYWEVVA
ncbi:MAG TPA: winged helix-turn-helix domain-containing protein [Tenuifilaceae bacterium]|mgnify:FL=1|nr:winged helix-turn-helix domain-containing protein [Tenuifilaceae bacterium]